MPKFLIIIAVIVIVFVVNAVRLAVKSSSHHFVCPHCGESFRVDFFRYMFTAHSFDGKCGVKCPKCGRSDVLPPLEGKE